MSINSTGDHWITRSLDRKLRSKYRLFVERRIELESHGIWLFTGGLTRSGRSGIFQRRASCQLDCTVDFWREMENWKTPGPRRTMPSIQPIDFQSSLPILRIREGKKRREQRFCEASSPFSRNKLNFARVQENEEKWRKGWRERVLEWNRVTIYFYLGRSTGRYCFFTRCGRSRVSLRAFQAQERNQRERERKTDLRKDRKEN